MRWQFFSSKIPPLNFYFVHKNVIKSQNSLNLGQLADISHAYVEPKCPAPSGPKYMRRQFFPPLYFDFVQEFAEKFKISSFGADPKAPLFVRNGPH